jgi:hypothetical protein
MSSYNIDPSWYMDSGATDHITGELEKLTARNKYQGGDQIHTTSGAGMDISHIGHAIVNTPHHPIQLKIFFMSLEPRKISFPFIVLPLIILFLLSFIPSSF